MTVQAPKGMGASACWGCQPDGRLILGLHLQPSNVLATPLPSNALHQVHAGGHMGTGSAEVPGMLKNHIRCIQEMIGLVGEPGALILFPSLCAWTAPQIMSGFAIFKS